MNKLTHACIGCLLLSLACEAPQEAKHKEVWKQEIIAAERQFDSLAQAEGIAKAFQTFVADDGVIKRGKKIIKGKQEIYSWYMTDPPEGELLTWKPDFVDVSSSGDMGYTYGQYIYSRLDSTGRKIENRGIFHSVWKRQQDGSWQFVYD